MHKIATLVEDGVAPFEFGVVCEVFGLDRSADGGPKFEHRVVTEHPGTIRTNQGFGLVVANDLSFTEEADLLVIPAGWDSGQGNYASEGVKTALQAAVKRGAWVLSVCSGAFTLGAAGLLDGRECTTHWRYADQLAKEFPLATVSADALYVEDRNVVTSAGTAAGIDACLHLVRRAHGSAAANLIARRMVVPPHREGGQSQYIEFPIQSEQADSLSGVTDWMLEHIQEDLTVDQLARQATMSPRTFARRFRADLGDTPAAWLNRQRILKAQELLEQTTLGLEEIAQRCGFGSAAVLRHHFIRKVQTTPTAYRASFSCVDEATM